MAKAVEMWTTWDFEGFGYEVGELFRELIMLAFPEKYFIDASGRLQLSQTRAASKMSLPSSTVIIGGATVSVLIALVTVRSRRSTPCKEPAPFLDIEEVDNNEAAE